MMDIKDLNASLRHALPQIRQYLSSQPIDRAWLFGSYSRGEENQDSDVDILVRYKDTNKISLFTIFPYHVLSFQIIEPESRFGRRRQPSPICFP